MPFSRFWAKASSISSSESDASSPGADCDAVAPLVFSAIGGVADAAVAFENWPGPEAVLAVALSDGLLMVFEVLENWSSTSVVQICELSVRQWMNEG